MQRYKGIYVIGTSHIANESVKEVEKVIKRIKPYIVALELDQKRFTMLMSGKKRKAKVADISRLGVKGFLFNSIGAWVERRLSKVTGIAPGSEMKRAAECAREIGANIALIDQDIDVTLRKVSARMRIREKLRMISDVVTGVLLKRGNVGIDLKKVPDEKIIREMTEKVRERYPSLYQVLIVERNEVMGKALYKLMKMKDEEKIVAVVGAGHEREVLEVVKKEEKRELK